MAAKKSSPLKIIPLGGLDGIGKNMTVFECGDDMVLVDAGDRKSTRLNSSHQ